MIVPHTRPNGCERNAGLLPQLALRRLLKGFTWLDATTRRAPIDGHIRETLVKRFGIVNVEQEQPLPIIKDEQARSWTDSHSTLAVCTHHKVDHSTPARGRAHMIAAERMKD